jgi:hypothetical protein
MKKLHEKTNVKSEIENHIDQIKDKREKLEQDLKNMPNQKRHRIASFIKSSFRIIGYGLLVVDMPLAVIVLLFSEVLGFVEETV